MIILASYYLKQEDTSSKNKIQINTQKDADTSYIDEIRKIADLIQVVTPNTIDVVVEAVEKFICRYNTVDFYRNAIDNYKSVNSEKRLHSALMLIDCFYEGSKLIQGISSNKEIFETDLIIKIGKLQLDWPDCLLLCCYKGGFYDKQNGDNEISKYIESKFSTEELKGITSKSFIGLLSASTMIYRNILGSKVCYISDSFSGKDFNGLIKLVGENYDIKKETTTALSKLINELSLNGIQLPIDGTFSPAYIKYNIGTLKISDIKYIEKDGNVNIAYRINDSLRIMYTPIDMFGVVNYALFIDMIVILLVLKNSSKLSDERASAIIQKYNLIYFRSVNIDANSYSQFLSLVE